MGPESFPILPAAKTAYRNRKHISKAWQWIINNTLGKKTGIVFTGMPGVGKTLLLDYISGKAYTKGYRLPGTSTNPEKEKIKLDADQLRHEQKKRLAITVIPGQTSFTRIDAIDNAFSKNNNIEGVVHVVANGFTTLRSEFAIDAIRQDANLEEYRATQIELELEDFIETCNLIQQSSLNYNNPKWMIIAVTKSDLFFPDIGDIIQYYSPCSESPFSSTLIKLLNTIGSGRFNLDAAPVCSWLEEFKWGDECVESQLKAQERDHLLAELVEKMQRNCLRRK